MEGVVIVLSILLAFAIDAWWDERKERIEETEILLGLKQEFTGSRALLQQQIANHSNTLHAVQELLMASRRGSWDSENLTVDKAIEYLIGPPTTDLGSGVSDALISAGRIDVLSNRELRFRIATWKGVFGEVHDDEVMNRNLVVEQILPYMMRWGIPLSRSLSGFTEDSTLGTTSIADDPDTMSRLWSDPEFEVIVEVRYGFLTHTTGEYQTAMEEIEKILEEIEKSISH